MNVIQIIQVLMKFFESACLTQWAERERERERERESLKLREKEFLNLRISKITLRSTYISCNP